MFPNSGSTSKEEPPLHWGSPFNGKPTASLSQFEPTGSPFQNIPTTSLNKTTIPKTTVVGTIKCSDRD